MSMSTELPTDDGFLRRECPHCEREFKWHHGPTEERPTDAVDPLVYTCPLCGDTAPPDHWWTKAQLEYAQQAAVGPAMRSIADELKGAFGKPKKGDLITISMDVDFDEPEPPHALLEPSDMTVVLSPCHPYEPIKVPDDWTDPVHCLLCGQKFALA